MTSSPGAMPAANTAACSAAVPELTATACRASTLEATARSKASTAGPVVSQSDRSAATTAWTSSSSTVCRAYGSGVALTGVPPWSASLSAIGQLPHLSRRQPRGARVTRVAEAGRRVLAALTALERPRGVQGLDHEHVLVFEGLAALVLGDQDLVEFLARPDADQLDPAAGRHGLDQVHHPHAGDLGHEDLAALREPGAADREFDALLQADPEARHPLVRHRDGPRLPLRLEERDHAAAAADDVAVAHHRARRAARMAV